MVDTLVISWMLGNVSLSEVFWSINISAEGEIVKLSDIALVEILSNEELEELLRWRDKSSLLQDSSELLN